MATMPNPVPDWRDKANRIIGELCLSSYLQANTRPDGTRYRKHRPYRVPDDAEMLIRCLAESDEATAKAYFVQRAMTTMRP